MELIQEKKRGFWYVLYWLLEEPTVFGARFDVSSEVAWVLKMQCAEQEKLNCVT